MNIDPIQEIEPKVGGEHSRESTVYVFVSHHELYDCVPPLPVGGAGWGAGGHGGHHYVHQGWEV